MSTPVLEVRGLAYAYPDGHQALAGVDLHVHEPHLLAVVHHALAEPRQREQTLADGLPQGLQLERSIEVEQGND